MTNEEAIKILKSKMDGSVDTSYEWVEAVRMAIEALQREEAEEKGWCHRIKPKEYLPSERTGEWDEHIKAEICDDICRYPYQFSEDEQADLDAICSKCPLERV